MPRLCSYAAVVVVVGVCLVGGRGACANHADDIIDLDDAHRSVPELIARYKYPVEAHTVTTSDGYILEMHRIPHGRDNNTDLPGPEKPAVLLVHGLLSSSADFIITGPSRALGFILAEAGFDVWIANCRGNAYSMKHTSLYPTSPSFWNFSFSETGTEDLPAFIDYILDLTGLSTLHYIGHSQGTTAFFVLCSLKPQYNAKFKSADLMAPVGSLEYINAPTLSVLAQSSNALLDAGTLLGLSEALPRGTALELVDGEPQCIENGVMTLICEAMLTLISDLSPEEFDAAMWPVLIGQMPSGASLKQFAHFGQMIADKVFRHWDFDTFIENLINYGTFSPPEYPLEQITVPMNLRFSLADVLTNETDVMSVHARLSSSALCPITEANFTHFLFAWGTRAKKLVYDDVIASMWEKERQ